MKKVGLALGGGGLRGTAHIGVLQVFLENSISVDFISGSSSGAVIAALFASGIDPYELEDLALKVKNFDIYDYNLRPLALLYMWLKVLLDYLGLGFPFLPKAPMGLIRGNRLEQLLLRFTSGKTFRKLLIPTAVTAVDINTGERLVFGTSEPVRDDLTPRVYLGEDVPVAHAVRASTAIPCIFEPKRLGSRVLVDGAVLDPVPAEPVLALGADVVIAVDVDPSSTDEQEVDNIAEVALRLPEVIGGEFARLRLKDTANIIIRPVLGDVGLSDFNKIRDCIEAGRKAAEAALPEIKEMLYNG